MHPYVGVSLKGSSCMRNSLYGSIPIQGYPYVWDVLYRGTLIWRPRYRGVSLSWARQSRVSATALGYYEFSLNLSRQSLMRLYKSCWVIWFLLCLISYCIEVDNDCEAGAPAGGSKKAAGAAAGGPKKEPKAALSKAAAAAASAH